MDEQQNPDSRPVTVSQIETIRRLFRAWDVDGQQLDAAAEKLRAERAAQHKRAVVAGEAADALTPYGVWLRGSMAQLQRVWAGRCVSCQHWTHEGGQLAPMVGECGVMHLDETNPQINIIQNVQRAVATSAPFGCILWDEIEQREVLEARTELAMAIGFLPGMPEGDGADGS